MMAILKYASTWGIISFTKMVEYYNYTVMDIEQDF